MKIALTVHQFLPECYAGTEILTYETAKELKRRGHDVEIWSGYPADKDTAEKQPVVTYEYDGLIVHRYNHSNEFSFTGQNSLEAEYNNIFFARFFNEYLCETKPDIVHFFHLSRLSASIIDTCFEQSIPCVLTPTDFWLVCPSCKLILPDNQLCFGPDADSVNCVQHLFWEAARSGRYVRKMPSWLLSMGLNIARHPWNPDRKYSPLVKAVAGRHHFLIKRMNQLNRILVPTMFMEKILVQNGMKPGISRLVPFGLNLKPFEKHKRKVRGGRLQVGFIGSLYEQKGAHVLVEAVKLLHKDLPLDVRIYGNLDQYPDYVAMLRDITGEEKRIEFCGHFKNELIGEVLSKIDVLVVPSVWYENTPLVIYSAFASGTPVIATNLGGMSEVVHDGVNGLLFEKGDSAGLGKLLDMIVNDRSLLDKLAKNMVPPASISEYADAVENVYTEVLTERG